VRGKVACATLVQRRTQIACQNKPESYMAGLAGVRCAAHIPVLRRSRQLGGRGFEFGPCRHEPRKPTHMLCKQSHSSRGTDEQPRSNQDTTNHTQQCHDKCACLENPTLHQGLCERTQPAAAAETLGRLTPAPVSCPAWPACCLQAVEHRMVL
jgi:hypothetical protein